MVGFDTIPFINFIEEHPDYIQIFKTCLSEWMLALYLASVQS